MSTPRIKPELLAPAGNWECARAAVANGADAIYFGLPFFNARIRADNFAEADLKPLMDFLHERGVRGFLTLNILIFTDELAEAERCLRMVEAAEVDAIIVQDVGLARLAREVAPNVEIHISTQMTITSPEGLRFARELGAERVVLARELSLRELAKFRQEDPEMLPLEVFVHGALCVAYSGQCLTSESMGQRSANRGECAQACRMPYELVVDGALRDLGDKRYLLSPQDLAAINDIPELVRLGIASFKIEGRLKEPEYVAAVTQVYRKAIDAAWENNPAAAPNAEDRYKLEMVFSRGLFSGWMHGVDHQQLVHARFGTKRGPLAGQVTAVGRDWVELSPWQVPLQPGDGVVFHDDGNTDDQQGGRIYEIRGRRLFFQHHKLDFRRILVGQPVYKTSDPQLERELRKSFAGELPPRSKTVAIAVRGRAGESLELAATCGHGAALVRSEQPLQAARAQGLSSSQLAGQLGRLGGTGFELAGITSELEGETFLPVSELNRMRRVMVEQLRESLAADGTPVSPRRAAGRSLSELLEPAQRVKADERPTDGPQFSLLCRSMDQLAAAAEAGVRLVYVDFEDIRRYTDAVAFGRQHAGMQVLLATPRIQKAGEQGYFKLIENAQPDGVLVRNLGGLEHFASAPMIKVGDFSLNVANPLTAETLMGRGLDYLTVSYDLNHTQVNGLLEGAPASWFELTLHQHMPMFHMEHCVYAAFLSSGSTHLDCGRPCDRHQIRLRDRVGVEHPVKVDVGCRNTVFQSKAQSGAAYWRSFAERGLRRFRVELVDETWEEALGLIAAYRQLLAGSISPGQLLERVKVQSQLGVTTGTLAVKRQESLERA
jgi:U32 family peptidase